LQGTLLVTCWRLGASNSQDLIFISSFSGVVFGAWALVHRTIVAVHLLCRLRFQLLMSVIWQFAEGSGGKTDSSLKKWWRKIRQCVP
jgi:hypothetical protein